MLPDHVVGKIEPTETGCWRWTRAIANTGYGVLNIRGKVTYAHRFVYESVIGPIPSGLTIDHLCRNQWCVNPDHLEPVPPAENSRRTRGCRIPKELCPHGHRLEGDNVIEGTRKTGTHFRQCRECFNARQRQAYAEKKPYYYKNRKMTNGSI